MNNLEDYELKSVKIARGCLRALIVRTRHSNRITMKIEDIIEELDNIITEEKR